MQARTGCQPAVAGQCHDAQRRLLCGFVQALRLQQRSPIGAFNQPYRHALTQALHAAPHLGLHAGQRGRAVQLQREKLVFINGLLWVRLDVLHKRAASGEPVVGRARQIDAFDGFHPAAHLHRASHAGRQIALKIKCPFALAHPAARALAGLRLGATDLQWRGGCGVAKIDGSLIELDDHLAHLSHFALG